MPKYHIELRTTDQVWETVDVERDDVAALRIEMARFVGELLKDHARKVWADKDWRVDVTDGDGHILYVMNITTTDHAAAAVRAGERQPL